MGPQKRQKPEKQEGSMRTEREDSRGAQPVGTGPSGVACSEGMKTAAQRASAPNNPDRNDSLREAREVYRRACMRAYRFGIAWSASARAVVDHYREPLNELNGFPVPDHDTGSNLAHTLRTLTEEFDRGMEELLFEDPADREDGTVPGLAHLWVRLGGIYERAIVSASRMARGNSGTLLCAWGLEAVRSYWDLPGNLTQELGPEAEKLPLLSALARDEERVRAAHAAASGGEGSEGLRGFDYAVAEARAMACAAERVRASVGEQMVPSTMLSVMMELASLDLYYRVPERENAPEEPAHGAGEPGVDEPEAGNPGANGADGSEGEDVDGVDVEGTEAPLNRARRAAMLRALERTAEYPPAPHLAGSVDAGALGFYLAVVHANPRWEGATLGEEEVRGMLTPASAAPAPNTTETGTETPAEEGESGWELMGTLRCEPLGMAQLRLELEGIGDSLLITPLDMAAGLWAVHVHVPEVEPARQLVTSYGEWSDERISSLADGHHAEACG